MGRYIYYRGKGGGEQNANDVASSEIVLPSKGEVKRKKAKGSKKSSWGQ